MVFRLSVLLRNMPENSNNGQWIWSQINAQRSTCNHSAAILQGKVIICQSMRCLKCLPFFFIRELSGRGRSPERFLLESCIFGKIINFLAAIFSKLNVRTMFANDDLWEGGQWQVHYMTWFIVDYLVAVTGSRRGPMIIFFLAVGIGGGLDPHQFVPDK